MEEKRVPEVRFNGFEEEWEEKKLGEVYRRSDERNKELIGYDRTISVATMKFKPDGNGASEHTLSTYKTLRKGDIAFEGHQSKEFRFGRFVVNDIGTGIVSPIFNTFSPVEEMPVDFWKRYIHSEAVMKHALANSTSSGIMMNKLVVPELLKQTIAVPEIAEQRRIGAYFAAWDKLIDKEGQKIDRLKAVKVAMLEKMFPKDGEVAPEIRFGGFTDDWEQRKLGEVVDVCSGRDYKHLEEGDIPVYGTGGYMLSVSEALSEDEDAIGIGRKGTIDKPYILKAPFWTVDTLFYCIPKKEYDLNFVYSIYQNINWKSMDESTGVPSLSKMAINKIEISTPSYIEQKKIGDYFSHLDRLITLHQRKYEKLKAVKVAMLEKMFPAAD